MPDMPPIKKAHPYLPWLLLILGLVLGIFIGATIVLVFFWQEPPIEVTAPTNSAANTSVTTP